MGCRVVRKAVSQGLVLLLRHDAVARILANGGVAFFESRAAIGWKDCDSVRSPLVRQGTVMRSCDIFFNMFNKNARAGDLRRYDARVTSLECQKKNEMVLHTHGSSRVRSLPPNQKYSGSSIRTWWNQWISSVKRSVESNSLWHSDVGDIGQTGSSNGLLPDSTKTLPESTLIDHQSWHSHEGNSTGNTPGTSLWPANMYWSGSPMKLEWQDIKELSAIFAGLYSINTIQVNIGFICSHIFRSNQSIMGLSQSLRYDKTAETAHGGQLWLQKVH